MALARAQDELYAMLGLTNPERHLRRSRSWNGLSISSPPVSSFPGSGDPLSNNSLHPQRALASRRSSLPPDSTLAQVSSALDADVGSHFHLEDAVDLSLFFSGMQCFLLLICYRSLMIAFPELILIYPQLHHSFFPY